MPAASPPADGEPSLEQAALTAAAEALYLEALNCCLVGQEAAADARLDRLGCAWRLSAAVWAAARGDELARDRQEAAGVLVHDAPLPPALLAPLVAAFHGGSTDFWAAHGYGADGTPFFSYLIDLQAAADGGPADALQAAALLLRARLRTAACGGGAAAAAAAAVAAAATHVECWAHTRPPWAPHQLHFDAAEGAMRRGLAAYRLAHPAASSVLFLSASGGPTLVLEQDTAGGASPGPSPEQREPGVPPPTKRARPAQAQVEVQAQAQQEQRPPLAVRAWLAHPAPGRMAVWPGDLLHGVLPGAPLPLDDGDEQPGAGGGDAAEQPPARTTLILAWWGCDPRSLVPPSEGGGSPGSPAGEAGCRLGPCMPMPRPASGSGSGDGPRWLVALRSLPLAELRALAEPPPSEDDTGGGWRALPAVAPAWERVRAGAAPALTSSSLPASLLSHPGLARAELPCLRFFLRRADDVSRAYVPGHD
ncbi:hypothetical protein HT031_005174 [Scenedesmus sp. PABB004]|nr:hypothetical protein HT031_005174 [Scenedesmus sp. PABB004]